MDNDILVKAALDSGAAKAVVFPAEKLVLSADFRAICEGNGCGNYGRCWMCPPDIGPIDALMAELKTYENVLWYQTIHEIEDSYDIEGMGRASGLHVKTSLKIKKSVTPIFEENGVGRCLHLSCGGCGGCQLCERCAKLDGEPCRHPDEAFPSLEGYGVNVYETTKDTDLKYINGQNTVTFFGMVVFGENK